MDSSATWRGAASFLARSELETRYPSCMRLLLPRTCVFGGRIAAALRDVWAILGYILAGFLLISRHACDLAILGLYSPGFPAEMCNITPVFCCLRELLRVHQSSRVRSDARPGLVLGPDPTRPGLICRPSLFNTHWTGSRFPPHDIL